MQNMLRGPLQVAEMPDKNWWGGNVRSQLQSDISWNPADHGAFVAAVGTDVCPWFLTPSGYVWINGIDGETALRDTVSVFETSESALTAVWRWRSSSNDYQYKSIYQLFPDGEALCANEVLRLGWKPKPGTIGSVLFQAESISFDVYAWAVSQGLLDP